MISKESKVPYFDTASDKEWFYAVNILGALFCILFVALISCMFLGFLTLDTLDLQIKIRAAISSEERRQAESLLPIVKQHHRLMVTLLLINSLFYEMLPLFLDNLIPSWATILLSVTLLLVFGEIIPSAIFTGPDQLRLASRLVPLMTSLMFIFYPIAMPLTRLLSWLVPHDDDGDGDFYHRGELTALIKIQHEQRLLQESEKKRARAASLGIHLEKSPRELNQTVSSRPHKKTWQAFKKEIMEAVVEKRRSRSNSFSSTDSSIDVSSIETKLMEPPPLHISEVKMVEGALTLKTKVAMDIFTPTRDIYAIPTDMTLNKNVIAEIYSEGYSRIPVYEPNEHFPNRRNAMRGYLLTRNLLLIDWDDEREISTLPLQSAPCVSPRMNLVELLHLLQRGRSIMAFVCAQPLIATSALKKGLPVPVEAGFLGIVTLEDVLESVLQEEIFDERDYSEQTMAGAVLRNWAATVLQRFLKKKAMEAATKKDNANLIDAKSPSDYSHGFSELDLEKGPLLSKNNDTVTKYDSLKVH